MICLSLEYFNIYNWSLKVIFLAIIIIISRFSLVISAVYLSKFILYMNNYVNWGITKKLQRSKVRAR